MLEAYYVDLEVYEDVELDWDDNPPVDENGDLTLKTTITGFIQMSGGNRGFNNQALMPNSTHIMYTDISEDFIEGDYIKYLDKYYLVEYIPPQNGISGIFDHLECGLVYQNNIV